MRDYLIKRVLLIVPTLLLISVIVFLIMRLMPGDIVDTIMQRAISRGGSVDREAVERAFGLDVPIHVQYGRWIGDIFLHGNLGDSLRSGQPVTREIFSRVRVTFELGLFAIITALLLGLPIGVYSAYRQDTLGDYIGRSIAIVLLAVPTFWLATMVILYPAIWWAWSPSLEVIPFTEDPLGNLAQFVIPGFITGTFLAGVTMRMTRTMMLEVLRQDYIRTAYAKGLAERLVVTRHALKNALIPVITIIGMELPLLVGGTVITEQIFTLPGMGRLFLDSLENRDYTMVSGINLIIATAVVGANLLVDISYAYLDPRVRYG